MKYTAEKKVGRHTSLDEITMTAIVMATAVGMIATIGTAIDIGAVAENTIFGANRIKKMMVAVAVAVAQGSCGMGGMGGGIRTIGAAMVIAG